MPAPNRFVEGGRTSFGTQDARWRHRGATPQELAAAFFQHQTALRVRTAMAARGLTFDGLGAIIAQDGETVRRKLNGDQRAQLADLLAWAMALGLDVLLLWPDDPPKLFPAELRFVASGWRAGELRLPAIDLGDLASAPWPAVTDHLADAVATAFDAGTSHLLDESAVADMAAARLVVLGVPPSTVWVRQSIDDTQVDLVLGTPPKVALTACCAGAEAEASAQATTAALAAIVDALLRVAQVPVPRRLTACVVASSNLLVALEGLLGRDLSVDAGDQQARFHVPGGRLHGLVVGDDPARRAMGAAELGGRIVAAARRDRIVAAVLEVDKLVL